MKVLNLQCAHGHGFEGWFASNTEFETQMAGGLVSCPMCGDTTITKLLTAPRLNLSNAKPPAEPKAQPAQAPEAAAADAPNDSPEAVWMRTMREALSKAEDVGRNFAEEARKMHYGDAEVRSIRGEATVEEARELAEEGVPFLSLSLPPPLKETLQ
ncbi:DUF1178 family protein [Variovorax defluvii]|uniref:DUF1178 family protein n=1 Tax=Variovorax defluvii TaxID=913761 RepID=A0ABP8H272_9BURK